MHSKFPNRVMPYILLMPSITVIVIFFLIPTIRSIYQSFFRVSPFGDRRIFVGFGNFSRLFNSPSYVDSLIRTLIFAGSVVVIGLIFCVIVAALLNQRLRGMTIYRTFFIWTYAISPAIAGTVWALMFNPATGPVVYLVKLLTGKAINWMNDGNLALAIVIIAAVWKMMGYNIIFYLAGLQAVPNELLEAAAIDGADGIKRFVKVTLPLLSPTTFFLLIMNMLYAFFEVFGLIDIMTKGGPGNATEILVYKLYRDGFIAIDIGFASAQSVVLFIFVTILTVLQFRYTQQKVFYG
ncbi:MAG: carbohydrate ABC transporter permease [Pseudothermotoga sp.]